MDNETGRRQKQTRDDRLQTTHEQIQGRYAQLETREIRDNTGTKENKTKKDISKQTKTTQ